MTVVQPVPPLTPRDIANVRTPLDACASCGYLGIRPPGIGDVGGLPENALMTERMCPRCGHRGPPVEFDAREDYVAFVDELNVNPSQRDRA